MLVESIIPLKSTCTLNVLPSLQPPMLEVSVWLKVFPVRFAAIGPDTVLLVTVSVSDSFTVVVVNPEQLVWAWAGNKTVSIIGFDHCLGAVIKALAAITTPLSVSLR